MRGEGKEGGHAATNMIGRFPSHLPHSSCGQLDPHFPHGQPDDMSTKPHMQRARQKTRKLPGLITKWSYILALKKRTCWSKNPCRTRERWTHLRNPSSFNPCRPPVVKQRINRLKADLNEQRMQPSRTRKCSLQQHESGAISQLLL